MLAAMVLLSPLVIPICREEDVILMLMFGHAMLHLSRWHLIRPVIPIHPGNSLSFVMMRSVMRDIFFTNTDRRYLAVLGILIEERKKQLAIQEDETALVIYALWQHYEKCLDLEFIETIYNTLIKKAADFMCSYIDEETGLPMGSCWTLGRKNSELPHLRYPSVFAGLSAAHNFAKLLGNNGMENIHPLLSEYANP